MTAPVPPDVTGRPSIAHLDREAQVAELDVREAGDRLAAELRHLSGVADRVAADVEATPAGDPVNTWPQLLAAIRGATHRWQLREETIDRRTAARAEAARARHD